MENIENTIHKIMVYINLNLFEHMTLDMLSKEFAYSKFHLHRKFKDIVGITLNEYIRKRRIENSIYFLSANPGTDISEIAGYCGFSSATYSREFRKVFNRTPMEWRNIYKRDTSIKKDSNICKNYSQFIDYNDTGIPREIKDISMAETDAKKISTRIYYGNYYTDRAAAVWEEVKNYNSAGGQYILVSMNSPAVTDINSCLYLIGFESDSCISGLNDIVLEGGAYIKMDYQGSRDTLREAYTWIIKYYFQEKGLKYDYRVQYHEYVNTPDQSKNELSCKIYIPISYA